MSYLLLYINCCERPQCLEHCRPMTSSLSDYPPATSFPVNTHGQFRMYITCIQMTHLQTACPCLRRHQVTWYFRNYCDAINICMIELMIIWNVNEIEIHDVNSTTIIETTEISCILHTDKPVIMRPLPLGDRITYCTMHTVRPKVCLVWERKAIMQIAYNNLI